MDFILTEDSDLLAFGAPKVLFKFNFKELNGEEVCLEDIKKCEKIGFGKFTHSMFLTTCILAGCDYLPNIKLMGFKTARSII